jgi:hypothetical protein
MASHSIDGNWRGHYTYAKNPDGGSGFDANFVTNGEDVSGDIMDDFWPGAAVLSGTFSFPSLKYTKSYIGQKLASVEYQGTMNDDGKTISGAWSLVEGEKVVRGAWTAYRTDQESKLAKAKLGKVVEKVDEVY